MSVTDWSPQPSGNAVADRAIPARDGAAGREIPEMVRGVMAGMRRYADAQGGALVTGGRLNAYTVDTALGVTELRPGLSLIVKVDRDNTAEATLNVDGSGPLPWVDAGGVRLQAGRIIAGRFYNIILDADALAWRVQAGSSTLDEIPGLIDLRQEVSENASSVAAKTEATTTAAAIVATQAGAVEAARAEVAGNTATVATAATQVADDAAAAQSAQAVAVTARDQAQAAVASGRVSYATLAQLQANLAPADGAQGEVRADPVPARNGIYDKVGPSGSGSWEKWSSTTLPAVEARTTANTKQRLDDAVRARALFGFDFTGSVIPVVADSDGRVHLGVDALTGNVVGRLSDAQVAPSIQRTIQKDVYPSFGNVWGYAGTGTVYPIVVGTNGAVALGFDRDKNELVGLFPASQGGGGAVASSTALTPLPSADRPLRADWNGAIAYGQSLSIGATGLPPLSTAQIYANLTFGAGPKATKAGSSSGGTNPGTDTSKPLVEDSLGGDGGTDRGETICSGLANGAVERLAVENGGAPSTFVIFASAAGKGNTGIGGLSPGSTWWQNFLDHITDAKALATAAGKSYALHAVPWLQGEASINSAGYEASLSSLVTSIDSNARAITGQATPVHTLLYQTAFGVKTSPAVALAQLSVAQAHRLAHHVSAIYHMPYSGDGTHLTNVGYLWLGRYFARAYKLLVIDGVEPPSIRPISATLRGTELRVRFSVPRLPLVLDSASLAAALNGGFVVRTDSGEATISAVAVDTSSPDTVVLTLAAALAGANPRLRYALDNLGTGLNISNGASGNLRDSTPDRFSFGGLTYPLWHVAPHFELPILTLASI
ncbi:hypothetical protein [Methylorubrum populi]|uniref:Sialate O-acetylesterase domain-containing protein n=1 Tax=Methylorubrum populi TaxID=223967 RepID=A0A833J108_9HYPH|nr:hypothetical protein [Methylorubrum populi]KAB7782179.1 hypothetical protein F8B43_4934 [Methylorubrum populi]